MKQPKMKTKLKYGHVDNKREFRCKRNLNFYKKCNEKCLEFRNKNQDGKTVLSGCQRLEQQVWDLIKYSDDTEQQRQR